MELPRLRFSRRRGRGRLAPAAVTLGAATCVAFLVAAIVPASPHKATLIEGTSHADRLIGTEGPDVISGKGRGDLIRAHRGPDLVLGGAGFDRLRGARGADRLLDSGGGAKMVGGKGRDEFNMKNGVEVGGSGNDVIHARDGFRDVINCGPGNDVAIVDRSEDGVFDCERIKLPQASQKRVKSHGTRR